MPRLTAPRADHTNSTNSTPTLPRSTATVTTITQRDILTIAQNGYALRPARRDDLDYIANPQRSARAGTYGIRSADGKLVYVIRPKLSFGYAATEPPVTLIHALTRPAVTFFRHCTA